MSDPVAAQASVLGEVAAKGSSAEIEAAETVLDVLATSGGSPAGAGGREVPWVLPGGDGSDGAARGTRKERLHMLNSLTRTVEPFRPVNGNLVKWYSCGPTVYDHAHIGHARNYVTFDILRRILEDYFGYTVFAVENITDIDDKIILRARHNHLFAEYLASHPVVTDDVVGDVEAAVEHFDFDATIAGLVGDAVAKQPALEQLRAATEAALTKARGEEVAAGASSEGLLNAARDVLVKWLDSQHGAGLTDHSIFSKLTLEFEASFLADMEALNVRPPDVLTRVSEYVPEIVTFVEKIIANGAAYEVDGSVYFDTGAFMNDMGHQYCKLEPQSASNIELAMEGEGALSATTAVTTRKRPSDFALWKKSKPGEPYWESPWGRGRPGWHIECSAMASVLLGSNMDIHSGGVDLKFPHHDNELAQSEAYYHDVGCHQWVNYFLHAGHLHIRGYKMSKSLKNFITIRQALETYSPRQLRMLFLSRPWHSTFDFSDSTVEWATATEKLFREFFITIDSIQDEGTDDQRWGKRELQLYAVLRAAMKGVDDCLCDNFDTPGALGHLRDIVKAANVYIGERQCKTLVLTRIAEFVTRILNVFGLNPDPTPGMQLKSEAGSGSDEVSRVLETLSTYRDRVRDIAISGGSADEIEEATAVVDTLLEELAASAAAAQAESA